MIQTRRRHHRGMQVSASLLTSRFIGVILILLCIAALSWFAFRMLPQRITGERVSSILSVEGRGEVYADLQGGGLLQRADSGLKLYEGDRLQVIGEGTIARITFFDGTEIVLGDESEFIIGQVLKGEEVSLIEGSVTKGNVRIQAGEDTSVQRNLYAQMADYLLPPRTNALLSLHDRGTTIEETFSVYDVTGPGVKVSLKEIHGAGGEIIVGEGQQSVLTPEALDKVRTAMSQPYDLRSPLHDEDIPRFVAEEIAAKAVAEEDATEGKNSEDIARSNLSVSSPIEGALLEGETTLVEGKAGGRIVNITVNGYSANLKEDGTFSKEVALPNEEKFTIEVHAEGQDGLLLDSKSLSVRRDIRPPDAPIILMPGTIGQTVTMNEDVFEIIGSASKDTVGIIVNGYRLQKYEPGHQWHYLVDPKISNVIQGENTYEVIAIDRSGNQSETVSITIVWKAQMLDMTEENNQPDDDAITPTSTYLQPGSITITSPTTGTPYRTNESAIAIEGKTISETASISINGFVLTLYEAGSTDWRYVCQDSYNNYRLGTNTYTIATRNSEGKILDVLRYIIEREK